jgi:hypothetical protein
MNGDRMTFGDAYSGAVLSGNLQQFEYRISNPDRLMALAFCDRKMGSEMYRAKTANDPQKIREMKALWRADLLKTARARHWRVKLPVVVEVPDKIEICEVMLPMRHVWLVADVSLKTWLLDVCPECTGRKFQLLNPESDGKQVLSEKACQACGGSGRLVPDVSDRALIDFVEEAIRILRTRYETIGRRATKRLRQ